MPTFRIYLKDLVSTRPVNPNDPLAGAMPDSSSYWGEGTMYVLGLGLKRWYDAVCNPTANTPPPRPAVPVVLEPAAPPFNDETPVVPADSSVPALPALVEAPPEPAASPLGALGELEQPVKSHKQTTSAPRRANELRIPNSRDW